MKLTLCLILLLFLMTPPAPVFSGGHHATAAQFDVSHKVRLKGTIAKLDWANPHIHVAIDVKGERGEIQHWDVELGSPGAVIVAGLSKDALKPGTVLTFDGYPGKANEFSVCATQVTLPDGTSASFVVGI